MTLPRLALNPAQDDQVPFSRSRFLGLLGTGLTALATRAFAPRTANAQVGTGGCTGTSCYNCCDSNGLCKGTSSGCYCYITLSCTGATQCWFTCWNCVLWRCCDFIIDGAPCMCQAQVRPTVACCISN